MEGPPPLVPFTGGPRPPPIPPLGQTVASLRQRGLVVGEAVPRVGADETVTWHRAISRLITREVVVEAVGREAEVALPPEVTAVGVAARAAGDVAEESLVATPRPLGADVEEGIALPSHEVAVQVGASPPRPAETAAEVSTLPPQGYQVKQGASLEVPAVALGLRPTVVAVETVALGVPRRGRLGDAAEGAPLREPLVGLVDEGYVVRCVAAPLLPEVLLGGGGGDGLRATAVVSAGGRRRDGWLGPPLLVVGEDRVSVA